VTRRSVPTRTLSDRPHLDQLRRQARELLDAFREGSAGAAEEVHAHYRHADAASFALHDAQLVLARAYGFDSWPKLKAFVDGVTVQRLIEAVRAGDLEAVRSMVTARPELVQLDVAENDEHRALHHAVLQRRPDIVRFLMQQGADARKGIWPHRGATTAFTLAAERGYDEIVRIIEEEEQRRAAGARRATMQPAVTVGPVDAARTAQAAIATGDRGWLEARHREGMVTDGNRLVSQAVTVNRPDMLALLLEMGLDPDEAGRVEGLEEVVPTWGEPLRACAIAGNIAMAEMLLTHGARPNTNVYAASSALYEAYKRRHHEMIALIEGRGGRLAPVAVAELGLVEHAVRWLARAAEGQPVDSTAGEGADVAQDLLWGAIGSSSPEIVKLALEAIDWPRDDARWHGILENGLYLGPDSDRSRHLEAFRLVLDRCDPSVRSRRGTTILHEVAASRGGLTAGDRTAFTTLLLDRGTRLDVRDELLQSTPLGWACRWGRPEMVKLLLERGADPIDANAPPWATPTAWANKMRHRDVAALLETSRPA
jgi:ankyrin repeat protein